MVDKKCIIIAIFFDFTKAFDNVCHVRLINKLRIWLCELFAGFIPI